MRPLVLLVGDMKEMCKTVAELLKDKYEILKAGTAIDALEICKKHYIDCMIIDQIMPDMDGVEVLKALKMGGCRSQIIMLTTLEGGKAALDAMKHGAYGVLAKPLNGIELGITVERAVEKHRLECENNCLSEYILTTLRRGIIGGSEAVLGLRSLIATVADADTPVLLVGEMGTGKELAARAIHAEGKRARRPFVIFDCSRPDSAELEIELFGCVDGYEGNAGKEKVGWLECASGGTLYLESIEWLAPRIQELLVRVIQEKGFRRMGCTKFFPLSARLISASGIDLREAVERGTFRQDLFMRLGMVSANILPLRERKEDIRDLVIHFAGRNARKFGKPEVEFDEEVMRILAAYPWPGNVSELKSICKFLMRGCEGDKVTKDDLPLEFVLASEMAERARASEAGEGDEGILRQARQQFERLFIRRILEDHGGNQAKAARALGVHRNTLINKMKELRLREIPGKSRRKWLEAES